MKKTIPPLSLSEDEKNKFLNEHLRHRLTLLRTFRGREGGLRDQGDIYRCVKDSNLIAVRLLLDFMGLRGHFNEGKYTLEVLHRKYSTDVKIDQFIGRLIKREDVEPQDRVPLAGVYVRADKELAHLTTTFNEEYNEPEALIAAATIVEKLLKKYLYDHLGKELPEMD